MKNKKKFPWTIVFVMHGKYQILKYYVYNTKNKLIETYLFCKSGREYIELIYSNNNFNLPNNEFKTEKEIEIIKYLGLSFNNYCKDANTFNYQIECMGLPILSGLYNSSNCISDNYSEICSLPYEKLVGKKVQIERRYNWDIAFVESYNHLSKTYNLLYDDGYIFEYNLDIRNLIVIRD